MSAAADLVGTIDAMDKRLARVEECLAAIMHKVGADEPLTVAEIAARQGLSAGSIYRTPWRLPNFGRPDYGEGVKRWRPETWEAWKLRPEYERRREWEEMTAKERREVMGRSA